MHFLDRSPTLFLKKYHDPTLREGTNITAFLELCLCSQKSPEGYVLIHSPTNEQIKTEIKASSPQLTRVERQLNHATLLAMQGIVYCYP